MKTRLFSKFEINYLNLFVLASLVFVGIYLSKQELVQLPVIKNWWYLSSSIIILLLAYLIDAFTWQKVLEEKWKINYKSAIISSGLAIFAKYIPGKVFSLIGRTEYLRKTKSLEFKTLNQLSLELQILAIITGFVVGGVLIFYLPALYEWRYLFLLVFVGALYYMFSNWPRKIAGVLLSRTLQRKIEISKIRNTRVIRLMGYLIIYWLIMGFGFYLFCSALTDIQLEVMFIMPLSVTVGVVALIAPGGIGIREGVVTLGLVFFGVEFKLAAGIAVAARLWFFVVETILFIASIYIKKVSNHSNDTENKLD